MLTCNLNLASLTWHLHTPQANMVGIMCTVFYLIIIGFAESSTPNGVFQLFLGVILIGICGGMLVFLLLSLLVFPQSATRTAISEMQNALQAVADLHSATWDVLAQCDWMRSPAASAILLRSSTSQVVSDHSLSRVDRSKRKPPSMLAIDGEAAQRVEDAISAFVAATQAVEDCLVVAENELFAGR